MKKISLGGIFYFIFFIIVTGLYLSTGGLSIKPNESDIRNSKITFKDKEYRRDFSKLFSASTVNISSFENDTWGGEYFIGEKLSLNGKDSLSLLSKNNEPVEMKLQKNLSLVQMSDVKLLLYSKEGINPQDIKSFVIRFSDKQNSFSYEYPVLTTINQGWNIVSMPLNKFSFTEKVQNNPEIDPTSVFTAKINWNKIELVTIALSARPHSRVELFFDRLWAEKIIPYEDIFQSTNEDMFTLKVYNNKSYVNVLPLGSSLVQFKDVTSVSNFSYTLKLIPTTPGDFGINGRIDTDNGYGYYLDFGGIGTDVWRLYKEGKQQKGNGTIVLSEGHIGNFEFHPNIPVWLRLEFNDKKIKASISNDGIFFIKLVEKNDEEHSTGTIGFRAGSSILVESVNLVQ